MKSAKNNISVVIPNFNGEDLLKKNLSKIIALEKDRKNLIQEIIIVDDGSTDGSVKYIKENFPKIRLIKHKVNRGVPSVLNTGVRSAKGDLVLIISIDMEPDKNLILNLLPHFEDSKIFGISFGKKETGPEKAFWKDGFIEFKFEKESKETKRIFYLRMAEGIFRRYVWIDLGGMDEKLFSPFFWEDLDICYRAAKRGYQCLLEPKAIVEQSCLIPTHKFAPKFIKDTDELHMIFFIWKNIHSTNFMRKHVAGIFIKLIKNPLYLKILLTAALKMPAILKERRREIRESKVSDEAIFSRFSA
jgi:GT2 family glycosyltransferase